MSTLTLVTKLFKFHKSSDVNQFKLGTLSNMYFIK